MAKREREDEESGNVALDETRVVRIRKLMVSVGQGAVKPSAADRTEKQLLGLRMAVQGDLDEEQYAQILRGALVECACSFAWKAPVYAAFLSLLPENDQESCMKMIMDKLSIAASSKCDFDAQPAAILRLLCEICNCGLISLNHLQKVLSIFLDKGYASCVLRAVAWLKACRKTEDIAEGNEVDSLRSLLEEHFAKSEASLASDWATVQEIWASNNLLLVTKPYEIPAVRKGFTRTVENMISLNLESLDQLESCASTRRCYNTTDLGLFEKAGQIFKENRENFAKGGRNIGLHQQTELSGVEEASALVSNISTESKWILRSYTEEILDAYSPFVREAAEALLEFSDENKHDHYILECTLSILANNPSQTLFLERVILTLIELYPKRFVIATEDAIDSIMLLLPTFGASVRDAFSDWFAFQLATDSPKWPWPKWIQFGDMKTFSDGNQKRFDFLKQTVEKFSLLCFNGALEKEIPRELFSTLLSNPPRLTSRFSSSGDHVSSDVIELEAFIEFIRSKPSTEETKEWVEKHLSALKSEDLLEYLLHGLFLGESASFTHFSKSLERVEPGILSLLQSDPELETTLISQVFEFYQPSSSWLWKSFVLTHLVYVGLVPALKICKYMVKHHPEQLDHWQAFVVLRDLLFCPGPIKSKAPELPKTGAFGEITVTHPQEDKDDDKQALDPREVFSDELTAIRDTLSEAISDSSPISQEAKDRIRWVLTLTAV